MGGSIYFKYLGRIITNQTSIQEEIKSRIKSENACCHLLQNLLSFSLFSKNINIKIYRTIILPVVLYGCETWSLTLSEERRLRVFENSVKVKRSHYRPGQAEGSSRMRFSDFETIGT